MAQNYIDSFNDSSSLLNLSDYYDQLWTCSFPLLSFSNILVELFARNLVISMGKPRIPQVINCFGTSGHLSIEQKIGVNLDGVLFDPEIVLQLSLVTRELLVKGLRLPEVIVQDLEGVQDVGHFGHQLSLRGITLFLQVGFLSPLIYQTYLLGLI